MTRTHVLYIVLGLAVLGAVAWVARHTYWGEITVPMPLRGEALRNPFYAAQRLAEALGAHTERRRALGDFSHDGVVVLSSFSWDVSAARRKELENWVEQGGRLVVDGTLIAGSEAFETWSGIERIEIPNESSDEGDRKIQRANEGSRDVQRADEGECPTLVEKVGVGLAGHGKRYAVCSLLPQSWLYVQRQPTWQLADDLGPQTVRVRVGRGSVTRINAVPFLYRGVLTADDGALFVAATQLRNGDRVAFLSEGDQESLLALMWRYGGPAVSLFVLFVVLALWRGGQRFGPLAAATDGARRSLAEQIRGTGRFALRWGAGAALHAAAVRALNEASLQHVGGYGRMNETQRIAALASFTAADVAALTRAFRFSAERSFHLPNALALLESTRRQVLAGSRSSKHGQRS
jgi:hypothetical protein